MLQLADQEKGMVAIPTFMDAIPTFVTMSPGFVFRVPVYGTLICGGCVMITITHQSRLQVWGFPRRISWDSGSHNGGVSSHVRCGH